MPRTAAQDTPGRRELKVLDSVTRRLDELGHESRIRVIDWIDVLIDSESEVAEAELKSMKAIAGQFQGLDAAGRERVVRWLNEHYGKPDQSAEDGPIPL